MKLLIIIDDLVSAGTENVLASRLANLSDDIDVYIVTLYALGPVADTIRGLGVEVDFIDMGKTGYRRGIHAVQEIIKREKIEIALCMRDVARGLFPYFLKKYLPVVMFWDNPQIKRSFRQSIAEWFQIWFSNSYMYCCSNVTRQALRGCYGQKEISVMPNCYDDRKFNADYNTDIAAPVKIVSVGHLRDEKKHADKILIASHLKDSGCNFKLEIIGQGDSKELQGMIDEHDLKQQVFLIGEKDDVSTHLRSSHIFLFTSQTEGFPVSLLEAMASGLPCITYQFPGLEEIDEDFSRLEVVAQGDIDTAVEKIMYYAGNPEACRELGEKAAEHVAEHFSAKVNTQKWEEYLISIARGELVSR